MGLIDKSVKCNVRTGSAVIKASKTVVTTGVAKGSNILVNYTPDFYDDNSQNFATESTKFAVGSSVMMVRGALRPLRATGHSLKNVYRRRIAQVSYISEAKHEVMMEYIKKKGEAAWNKLPNQDNTVSSDIGKTEKPSKTKLNTNKNEYVYEQGKAAWDKLSKEQQENLVKDKWKKSSRKEKWRYYENKGITKGAGVSTTASSLAKSSHSMISNQMRRGALWFTRQDDMTSKAIGQTYRSMRGISKGINGAKKASAFIKSVPHMIVGFCSFIPSLLISIVSLIPVVITVMGIVSICMFFGDDFDFSGRISQLSENELQLENDYHTSINPQEVLAITKVLNWTTQDVEDYEMLVGLMFDGKRDETFTFEEMMENVFNKYNPATNLNPNTPISSEGSTSWKYYTSEFWRNHVMGLPLNKSDWLGLYPDYQKAGIDERKAMGESAYIEKMKEECRESLADQGYNYLANFLTIENPPIIFTDYILPLSAHPKVSSPTGYRSIQLNGKTDKSFHYGTDIAAPGGTPVYAPTNSEVIYADGSQSKEGTATGLWGAGNVVILKKQMIDRKGESCYLYMGFMHMQRNSVTVKVGDQIKGGTQIGKVGTTGTSTGNHLHFQTWISVTNYNESNLKFVQVKPKEFNDNEKGEKTSVDSHDYSAIYIEGLYFYDGEYQNSLYGRR